MLLEESNNISETSLGLEESSGVNLEGVEELNGLLRSGNSFSVVLSSSLITGILVSECLDSVGTVLFIGGKILVLVLKFILGINLFCFEGIFFSFVRGLIVVGLLELILQLSLLVTAPATFTRDFVTVVSLSAFESFFNGVNHVSNSVQTARRGFHVHLNQRGDSTTEGVFLELKIQKILNNLIQKNNLF